MRPRRQDLRLLAACVCIVFGGARVAQAQFGGVGSAPSPSSAPAPAAPVPSAPAPEGSAPVAPNPSAAPSPQPAPSAGAPAATAPPPTTWTYPPYYYYYYPYPAPPPPQSKAPPPELHYPEDRAARTVPFFDLNAGGLFVNHRFSTPLVLGLQGGTYIARAVRAALRIGFFPVEADVEQVSNPPLPSGFQSVNGTDKPEVLLGASVGYAVISLEGFVLAPAVIFLTTDEADVFGSAFGVTLPFDWVNRRSMRIGFEVAAMTSFGGSVRAMCASAFSPTTPACDVGEVRDFDRPRGAGFYIGFQIGWGLRTPKPEQLPQAPTAARP